MFLYDTCTLNKHLYPCKKYSAHTERLEMDRRQFEEGNLKYACLQMAAHYPEVVNFASISKETNIKGFLENITPALFSAFEAKYGGLYILSH